MPMQVCTRCLLDTTLTAIRFDEAGVCQYCHGHDRLAAYYREECRTAGALEKLVERVRQDGRGRAYDCVVGVSGGVDSSFVLCKVKALGLRPLAVHFDNGWNSDEAVSNIKAMTDRLKVDLYTYVVNWPEFRDLQIAFLKASVPCIETPTDVGIHGALMKVARREGVRYILGGQSFLTEGTVPKEWGYLDGKYIDSVHRKFGTVPLRTFPNLSIAKILFQTLVLKIRQVPLLNYLDYDKTTAAAELTASFGWRPYGGNHHENIYSKFAFGWYLPRKFGIDKRKVYFSGPLRSGLMTRARAQELLAVPADVSQDLVDYCIRKLELTPQEFARLMALPVKSYRDYATSDNILRTFSKGVKLAVDMKLFTPVLYEKYCG